MTTARDVPDADGVLIVETTRRRKHEFYARVHSSHLSAAAPDAMATAARRRTERPWIAFAPHVGAPMAQRLREQGTAFVDRAGNCYLPLGDEHVAEVVGRAPAGRAPTVRELGEAGQRVVFALLAEPALVGAAVRQIAASAGVGKSTVANALARLESDGFVAVASGRRHLVRRRELTDRWVAAYANQLRPRLWLGAYRTPDAEPPALEKRLRQMAEPWALGGAAAAWRLTEYYRSPITVVHAPAFDADAARELRALRADDGPMWVLGVPGPLAFVGAAAETVHPLLVYAELVASGDDRARDAALEVRERYLEEPR